jgi:alkylhydroperoxidase family enzyme
MSADGLTRLAFDELDPALRAELQPVVDRLGYFGEFFQVCGAVPGAVSGFMAYTKAVKAPLSDAENEVLALAVCAELGAAYELIQHERLSVRLGLQPEWIAAAEGRQGADAARLSAAETALRTLALAALRRMGRDCAAELAAAAALLGPQKAAAALMQVTRFMGIAVLCNSLSLSLPVASIFDKA